MKKVSRIFIYFSLLTLFLSGTLYAKSYSELIKDGNAFYKDGLYKESIKAYEEAAKLSESSINVYFNLGLAYKHIKDYPSAVKSLDTFLKVSSDKKMLKSAKKLIRDMAKVLSKPTTVGTMKTYEVWDGWILIDGDVTIPKNIVLTIKPGSLVMFAPLSSRRDEKIPYLKSEDTKGFSSLIVRGTLIAQGTKENQILFSNSFEDLTTKRIGLWGGLIFDGSKMSILQHSKFERAKNAVVIKGNPKLLFKNNIFLKNDVAVKFIDKSKVSIDYNIFYRNETGIECDGAMKSNIINNNFTKNNYGIKTYDSSKPEIAKNTFEQNNCGVGTYDKSFPKIYENGFKECKLGISMTGNSKALINQNEFIKNKIGINSVKNSSPRIYQNKFIENIITGITAADSSKAEIDANDFISNNIGISKVDTVNVINNYYDDNNEDIKAIER